MSIHDELKARICFRQRYQVAADAVQSRIELTHVIAQAIDFFIYPPQVRQD